MISRVFPLKFLQIHITSVSGRFHDFIFNLVFWRVFSLWPNCAPRPSPPAPLRLPPPSPIMPRLSCTGNSSLEPRNEGSYNTVGLCSYYIAYRGVGYIHRQQSIHSRRFIDSFDAHSFLYTVLLASEAAMCKGEKWDRNQVKPTFLIE